MKIKVVKTFRDKETKKVRWVNSLIEYNDDRAAELIEKGFAEPVEEVTSETEESDPAGPAEEVTTAGDEPVEEVTSSSKKQNRRNKNENQ